MTQKQIWEQLYELVTFKQYCKITNAHGTETDGLPNLNYSTYFNRTLKYSRNKAIRSLALQGLAISLDTELNG